MIDIAELLKDAKSGIKLYSPVVGPVVFDKIALGNFPIIVKDSHGVKRSFTRYGLYYDKYSDGECMLYPSKDCRTWEGWKDSTEPKFKVNNWIIFDRTFTIPIQIIEVNRKNDVYVCKSIEGLCGNYSIIETDKNYHLWTIADAKDGDILISELGNPFIYNGKVWSSFAGAYIGISRNEGIRLDIFPSNSWTSAKYVRPATKEECDLLFAKMKEAGYTWDSDKKELKKVPVKPKPKFKVGDRVIYKEHVRTISRIDGEWYELDGWAASCPIEKQDELLSAAPKKHYDISNFHAGMPVLVRDYVYEGWCYVQFSHIREFTNSLVFNAGCHDWYQCIPFEGNEKLLGTTDMCDEQYINW